MEKKIMLLKLVGVTFATDRNPELKQLRPSGVVSFEAEPDNEYDPNAVKVMYKDQHIGYVPKSELAQKTALEYGTAKIIDYAYWDSDIKWNENHIGQFQSMKFEIGCSDMEDNGRIIGGRYVRCTTFLKYFDPYGGGDGLIRWAFNQGNTFEEYEEALNECAENGTLMHDAIEQFFDPDEFRPKLLPEGWDNFVDKYEPDWVYGEERFYDNKLMITGQPDFVGYINYKGRRIRAVVDWKSSKRVSMKHKIQASIYSMNCSIDEQPIEGALVVAFGANTKQKFSASFVTREQIESNYLAMEYVKKAMECIGVQADEY
jgi:hypothetical protein